jgi:hypothetical protein
MQAAAGLSERRAVVALCNRGLGVPAFFDHYATRMADGTNLDADGWFTTGPS